MSELRRKQQRVRTKVPVRIDGERSGFTRDVSPTGIFLETDLNLIPGSPIRFSIEFSQPSGDLVLECSGEVVRVEEDGPGYGVAIKINTSRLERSERANVQRLSRKKLVA